MPKSKYQKETENWIWMIVNVNSVKMKKSRIFIFCHLEFVFWHSFVIWILVCVIFLSYK